VSFILTAWVTYYDAKNGGTRDNKTGLNVIIVTEKQFMISSIGVLCRAEWWFLFMSDSIRIVVKGVWGVVSRCGHW